MRPRGHLPDFADPPLDLPLGPQVYRIPPPSIAAGVQVMLLLESGEYRAEEISDLVLGAAAARLRVDNVPAGFLERARDTALADMLSGREKAEQVWRDGAEAAAAAPKEELRGLAAMEPYGWGEKDPETGLYEGYDLPPEMAATEQEGAPIPWASIFAEWDVIEHAFAEIGIDLEDEWEQRTWRWFRTRLRGLLATDSILGAKFRPEPATEPGRASGPDERTPQE